MPANDLRSNSNVRGATGEGIRHRGVSARSRLGIRAKLLYRWRGEFAETPNEAFRGPGRRRARDEDLERLRRENERLRMEREILKKATAFFANHSQ